MKKFLFIDIETTGLYLPKSAIIQVACLVTDASLAVLDEVEYLVRPWEGCTGMTEASSHWRPGECTPIAGKPRQIRDF